jgi:hypothetical protein
MAKNRVSKDGRFLNGRRPIGPGGAGVRAIRSSSARSRASRSSTRRATATRRSTPTGSTTCRSRASSPAPRTARSRSATSSTTAGHTPKLDKDDAGRSASATHSNRRLRPDRDDSREGGLLDGHVPRAHRVHPGRAVRRSSVFRGEGTAIRTSARKRDPRYLSQLALFAEVFADVVTGGSHRAVYLFKEAMSTSDFPLMFGDVIDRSMLGKYREWQPTWPAYAGRRGRPRLPQRQRVRRPRR